MNKNDDLTALKVHNAIRAAAWIAILLVFAWYACARAMDKFQTQGDMDSVHQYNHSIWVMCLIAVFAAALWWGCATFSTGLGRRKIEEYSFVGSLFCIILVLGAAWVISILHPSIMDLDGRPHTMRLVHVFPAVFGCLMYCLPPVNLEKVIWPFGPRIIASAISLVILLGTVYLLFGK